MKDNLKAADYVELIEGCYLEAKGKRISRMSPEWGVWSSEMNQEIRKKIEENDPETLQLKYVFILWVTSSQLLELHHQSSITKGGRKRLLAEECDRLREMILIGEGLEDFDFNAAMLAQQVT